MARHFGMPDSNLLFNDHYDKTPGPYTPTSYYGACGDFCDLLQYIHGPTS